MKKAQLLEQFLASGAVACLALLLIAVPPALAKTGCTPEQIEYCLSQGGECVDGE